MQGLINALWERPTTVTDDGIMASLPEVTTVLPREKPLPKVKDLTKWEKFAKSKGIASKPRKHRMQFDEDKQEFAPTWGYKGKNNELQNQAIIEIPANAPADFDPRAENREEKKSRIEKNEKQRLGNISRASAAESRKRKSSSKR